MKSVAPKKSYRAVVAAIAVTLVGMANGDNASARSHQTTPPQQSTRFHQTTLLHETMPRYLVDVDASSVGFTVRYMGVSDVDGRFHTFNGFLDYDGTLESLYIEGTVDVESIDTGIRARDRHLRSEDYFNAERFPRILYRSTGVYRDGNTPVLQGEIEIRGIRRRLDVRIDVHAIAANEPADMVRITADGSVDRKTFELVGPSMLDRLIGDTVTIAVDLVGRRAER